MGTHTPYGDLSQRGLLDTIKTAYDKSRLDGRLRLTASAFNLLWISMPEVLVTYCYAELSASFIKFLHYCFLSSGFYGAWKDNRTRRNNNRYESHPIWTISAPTSITSVFMPNALSATTLTIYPGLGQAPNNAGLHTSGLVTVIKQYCNTIMLTGHWLSEPYIQGEVAIPTSR